MSSESVDLSQLCRDARGQVNYSMVSYYTYQSRKAFLNPIALGIYVLLMGFSAYKRLRVLRRSAHQFYILQRFRKKGLNSATSRLAGLLSDPLHVHSFDR